MKGWLWYAPTAASRPMIAHVLSQDGQLKASIGQFAVSACGTTRDDAGPDLATPGRLY